MGYVVRTAQRQPSAWTLQLKTASQRLWRKASDWLQRLELHRKLVRASCHSVTISLPAWTRVTLLFMLLFVFCSEGCRVGESAIHSGVRCFQVRAPGRQRRFDSADRGGTGRDPGAPPSCARPSQLQRVHLPLIVLSILAPFVTLQSIVLGMSFTADPCSCWRFRLLSTPRYVIARGRESVVQTCSCLIPLMSCLCSRPPSSRCPSFSLSPLPLCTPHRPRTARWTSLTPCSAFSPRTSNEVCLHASECAGLCAPESLCYCMCLYLKVRTLTLAFVDCFAVCSSVALLYLQISVLTCCCIVCGVFGVQWPPVASPWASSASPERKHLACKLPSFRF